MRVLIGPKPIREQNTEKRVLLFFTTLPLLPHKANEEVKAVRCITL